jgi:hypothetical protein
MLFKG